MLFFKTISVTRAVCFILVPVLETIRRGNSDGHGWNLDFPLWIYIIQYTVLTAVVFNTLVSLLLSFKPSLLFRGFLNGTYLIFIFYFFGKYLQTYFFLRALPGIGGGDDIKRVS